MDFSDSPEEAAYRAKARAWIAEHAPHHLAGELARMPLFAFDLRGEDGIAAAKRWQKAKREGGWAVSHWPEAYGGRGASPIERVIWGQEEGVYSRLSQPFAIGIGMCGPTLMGYAQEEQKRALLPRLASGEEIWCQLFSEPGAGSDLANVATKAARDGEDWVIDGQKVWTSYAQYADYGLLLARTDPSLPKHKGLTMFFVDMKAAGVEVRPIAQMNGGSSFNEVYFAGVRLPDAQRLGAVNDGWRVSISTLMHERMSAAMIPNGFAELFALCRRTPGPHGRLIDDPVVRSKLAGWATIAVGLRNTYYRAVTSLSRGAEPGPEASIGKLAAATMMQQTTRYALDLLGPEGMLTGSGALDDDGWFQSAYLRSTAMRIEAGSDEILRNIIAERVLGLPGEPRVDKDTPFNQLGG
jgi:acyl-CoA dehydrogenase